MKRLDKQINAEFSPARLQRHINIFILREIIMDPCHDKIPCDECKQVGLKNLSQIVSAAKTRVISPSLTTKMIKIGLNTVV